MSGGIYGAAVSLLGLVGLVAVGLFPFRATRLLAHVMSVRPRSLRTGACATLGVLMLVLGMTVDVAVALRVFRCLTTSYCGPNLASGWIYLAWLGLTYLVFEVVALVLRKVAFAASSRPD